MAAVAVWLVWSNEHGAWWGPNHVGYTRVIDTAGRYDQAEAEAICGEAGVAGPRLFWTGFGDESILAMPEVAVPAPD